jgi:hypothetical protein
VAPDIESVPVFRVRARSHPSDSVAEASIEDDEAIILEPSLPSMVGGVTVDTRTNGYPTPRRSRHR